MTLLPLRLAAMLLVGGMAQASTWTTLPERGIYARAGFHMLFPTRQYFNDEGQRPRIPTGRYRELVQTLYGEYGALDWLTATLELRSYYVGRSEPPPDGRGDGTYTFILGEFTPGVRAAFWHRYGWTASGELKLTIPRSMDEDPDPHRYGDGRFEGQLVGQIGRTFSDFYTNGGVGFRLRDETPLNQVLWLAAIGRSLGPYVVAEIGFYGAHAVGEAGAANDNPLDDVVAEESHIDFVPKVIGKIGPIQIDLYSQFTLFARAYADGFRLGVGVAYTQ
jgi:hypothetical protein